MALQSALSHVNSQLNDPEGERFRLQREIEDHEKREEFYQIVISQIDPRMNRIRKDLAEEKERTKALREELQTLRAQQNGKAANVASRVKQHQDAAEDCYARAGLTRTLWNLMTGVWGPGSPQCVPRSLLQERARRRKAFEDGLRSNIRKTFTIQDDSDDFDDSDGSDGSDLLDTPETSPRTKKALPPAERIPEDPKPVDPGASRSCSTQNKQRKPEPAGANKPKKQQENGRVPIKASRSQSYPPAMSVTATKPKKQQRDGGVRIKASPLPPPRNTGKAESNPAAEPEKSALRKDSKETSRLDTAPNQQPLAAPRYHAYVEDVEVEAEDYFSIPVGSDS